MSYKDVRSVNSKISKLYECKDRRESTMTLTFAGGAADIGLFFVLLVPLFHRGLHAKP